MQVKIKPLKCKEHYQLLLPHSSLQSCLNRKKTAKLKVGIICIKRCSEKGLILNTYIISTANQFENFISKCNLFDLNQLVAFSNRISQYQHYHFMLPVTSQSLIFHKRNGLAAAKVTFDTLSMFANKERNAREVLQHCQLLLCILCLLLQRRIQLDHKRTEDHKSYDLLFGKKFSAVFNISETSNFHKSGRQILFC